LEALGRSQKVHDFFELSLDALDPGDIPEGDALFGLTIQCGLVLAERKDTVSLALGAAIQPKEEPSDQDERPHGEKETEK